MPPKLSPLSRTGRAPLRAGLASVLLVPALLASALVSPATAKDAVAERAGSTYLCTGYVGCANAGYSNYGYQQRGGSMYWRMYAGHNCTNYVAYRLIQAGLPNVRPWDGGGNATYWGQYMSDITDRTPAVGAVAWWRANTPGAGSAGHVAIVEEVVSPTEIIVSEDSWGGDFHWRRISIDGSWPSGFIHFADQEKTLTNTRAPSVRSAVDGPPRVGTRLRARVGLWKPRATTKTFQWSVDGVAVPGATAQTFTPERRQLRRTVSVTVTGSREGHSDLSVTSAPTPSVERGRFAVRTPAALGGVPEVGETLTLTPTVFSPSPNRTEIAWYAGKDVIEGADGPELVLTEELRTRRISARVSAFAPGFAPFRERPEPTEMVKLPEIEVTDPAVLRGSPRAGQRLRVEPGGFTPPRAEVRYTWLRDGRAVDGADAASYDLTTEDVGRSVAVRVEMVRDGYRPARQVLDRGDVVRTTPELLVEAIGRRHRAVVRLDLVAPGVEAPDGEAVVRVGRTSVPVTVTDGRARVVVRELAAGERTVRVRYLGTDVIRPGASVVPVTVAR